MEKNKVRPSDLEDQNHSEFENSTEGLIKTKNEETKQVMFTIPDSPHEHLESLQDSKDTFSEGSELDDEFTKDDKRLDIPTIEEIYKNQAEKRPSISDPEQITKLSKPKAASKVDMNSLRGFELSDSNFSHVKFFDVIRLSSVVDVDQSYDKLRESSKQLSYEEKKEEPQKEEPSIKIFGENDGDFEWVESKENSVAFIISPISFHRSDSIKDSYKYFKDDKEEIFELLDEKEYEYNIETFATDLEFANKEKVFPLNINQPFFLKTRKGGITKFKIQMSEKKEDIHEVQTWILVRIRGSDKEHKVKPDIGYRLATIIDDKFYFLGRDPDDDSLRLWGKENDYGCTIEIKIWSNSEHEKNDRNQVQRLIFEDHPVLILDNESRVVSLCEQHTGEIELPPNYKGVSEIVATEHKSYKNISPRSWFQILHYKKEDILFIFTHLRLPKRSSAEYDYKSLCYTAEKAKINLSEEHIPFRVEPEENGIFLKTNTGFKLSFCPPGRAPLYLRSLPTQNSGVSKVIFTEYSPKHEEEFIFHFSRPFTDLNFRFSSDDKVAKLVKEWAYREEGSWQISTADYHKQLKKHISKMLLKHCAKEPNAQRKQKRELVCLNGWVDIQKITLCNKVHDFEKVIRVLKQSKAACAKNVKEEDLSIKDKHFYASCCEYVMLLGCSDSDFDQSSVLKKAVQITPSPLDLLDNDYRRIMILQKIVESNYKTLRPVAKDHKDYIYELDCFLPFLDFELAKEASEWNLPKLVGLMTNTYRSPHCVRSTGTINKGVVKYVCQKIEERIENRFDIDLHSLVKEWVKTQESQNLNLYYQGSIEADSLITFQNGPMRGLMIILIYSIGVKECGLRAGLFGEIFEEIEEDYIQFGDQHISQMRFEPDSKDTFEKSPLSFKDSLDIQGVCLRILCNFREDKHSIAQAIKKSIKFLFKSAKFDSIDQIRFACDVTGALIDLLKDDDYIETILELMKEYKILKELRKMANKVSDRTISAKPHAFDFIKYSYLDDAELRAANEAITEDVSHEVDVVKESYQRELVNKIFRIINFFIETSHSNPEYSRMVKGSEIYTNIFTQPPSKRTKKFFRTIQRSVLKWMNFELEPQISSEIFDTIIAVDSLLPDSGYKKNTEEIPMSKTNDIFLDLCLEVLPFFTHLKEKDFGPVYRLETQVGEIQEAIGDKNQHISETFLEHIYSIYNLVLLLIKINGLINRKDHPDPKSLAKAYSFVCVIYMCITEAVEHSEFAMALSKFSSDLLMLGWQNKSCNEQHIELLLILMKKSKSTKLNIDSCSSTRDINAKLGHLVPRRDLRQKMLNGKEELINCIVYKTERNYSKSIAQLLEYNVELVTQQEHIPHKTISNQSSVRSDVRSSIHSLNRLVKDNPQQSLNLVMMQVNDRFLMDWCGVEGEKSRLVDYLINKFLGKLENEETDDQRRATRFFQMFIDKIFDAVDKIDPNFITQQYVFHALAMLYHIADHKEIMNSNEIKGMFYTEHATNAIFTLITKEYDHIECARKIRYFAYLMLLKLYRSDIEKARSSFKTWTNQRDNKFNLFNRIKEVINEFIIFFGDKELCDHKDFDMKYTDFKELVLSIQWMRILCKNDSKWQDYLCEQDNSTPNQNIISSIIELLRRSLRVPLYAYVIDLQFVLVRFIIENVNGKNKNRIRQYVGSRVLDYAVKILKKGVIVQQNSLFNRDDPIDLTLEQQKKSPTTLEDKKHDSESESSSEENVRVGPKGVSALDGDSSNQNGSDKDLWHQIDPDINYRFQILMQYVLTMINSLIIPGTKHQFVNSQNHDLVNNIIKLNYMEFKVKRYDHYTTELMKNSIECRELNLNVGFQAFYLISKCFNNNDVDNRNFVQRIDSESLIEYYWRLLKGSWHHLKCAKGYTKAQKEHKLREYREDEELKVESSLFFDGYTSSIEIVLTDGSTVTKFFPILPCFMSFSQVEKDEFWNSANLDNSKTCVDSLMEFSASKIDELFAQQKVQDWWVTLRDAAKKANWLTDITCLLIFLMNFCLFFSLEINDGKILDNPKLFNLGKDATKTLLTILGYMILCLLIYLFSIQISIWWILQGKANKRTGKWSNKKRNLCVRFLQSLWYIWTHLDSTLQSRSIWCYLFCIGFSIAGIVNNFFWFAFVITYLTLFSPQILEVTAAIWMPRQRIISTVVLSSIILYWFAVIAYVYFGNDFHEIVGGSNQSMTRMLVVIFDSWYKFGLGNFLSDNGRPAIQDSNYDYEAKTGRILFDFLFFFVVPTLLLSILSGIIIDNFFERRSQRDTINERQNDQCFVCGIKANELPDFYNHTRFKHNLWDYMFYIGYIRAREDEELQNYVNMHVKNCLDEDINEWFPAYRDFVKAAYIKYPIPPYNSASKPSSHLASLGPTQKPPSLKSSHFQYEEDFSMKKLTKEIKKLQNKRKQDFGLLGVLGKGSEEDSEIEKEQKCDCGGKWKSLNREFGERMGAIERKLEMVLRKLEK